jgi:hypothetical protein
MCSSSHILEFLMEKERWIKKVIKFLLQCWIYYAYKEYENKHRNQILTKNFGQIILHCTIGYSFEEIMLVDKAKFACYVQLTSTKNQKQNKGVMYKKKQKRSTSNQASKKNTIH